MKLHSDINPALNTVTGYGTGYLEINRQRFPGSVLIRPQGEILNWPPASFETLAVEHFSELLALEPELVILGTGSRQRFPHPRITAPLAHARIGFEVMNTHAACRTYNILMSEGRKVLAALLPADGLE